jgi:hypothetical protein
MSSPSAQPGPDTPAPDAPAADTPAPDAPAADTPAPDAPAADTPAPDAPAAEAPAAEAPAPEADAPAAEPAEAEPAPEPHEVERSPEAIPEPQASTKQAPAKKAAKKGKGGGKAAAAPKGPSPEEITRRIGETNEKALAYVLSPDPKLSRLSRKAREALLPDLPPVVAGALLGPAALARHFIAYASYGRYRDLFSLWELFRQRPAECKPILAERQPALDKAREQLSTAIRLGLTGRADRAAEDVRRAEGLIWQWVREPLMEHLALVGMRPEIAATLLEREPSLEIPLPEQPDARWLDEAAAARRHGELPPALDALLAANIDRLPATVATLGMAQDHYPDRVLPLLDHVNLDGPEIGSVLAWARDHGYADRLHARIRQRVEEAAEGTRAEALAVWNAWRERGVDVPLSERLRVPTLEGLDLTKPESALLVKALVDEGADLQPQQALEDLAAHKIDAGEKAYEAFVCAGLPVTLPARLREKNIGVKEGTRCPACEAWTWVRPGHERRCPRLAAMPAEPAAAPAAPPEEHTAADDWEAAAQAQPAGPADPAPPQPTGPAGPAAAQPAAETAATAPQQVAAAQQAAPAEPEPAAPSGADAWEAAARDAALAEDEEPTHGDTPVDAAALPAAAPEPMPAASEPEQPAPGPAPAPFADQPPDDTAADDEDSTPPGAGAGA